MPADIASGPVFSGQDVERFTWDRSGRTYILAPLSYRQRLAMTRAVRRVAGTPPDRAVMLAVLRECLRELAPANLAEALSHVDEAEAEPENAMAQGRLAVIQRACADVAAYAEMEEAWERHNEERPLIVARYALRGWEGAGLPPFVLGPDGLVPESLLEAIPAAELMAIANRAAVLIWLGPSAAGNSEAPLPAPTTPTDIAAA